MTRVALVRGSADVRHDGVADYVAHLVDALCACGIDAVPVDVTSVAGVRADVVHVQYAPTAYRVTPGRVAALPGVVGGVPLVTTLHEYEPDGEADALLPASSAVVVTNATHAAAVRERLDRPPDVIPLAPNVCGRPGGRARDGSTLVFFGYVHPVKGVRYLIEAVALVRRRHPRVRLLVVGGFTSLALPEPEAEAFRAELAAHARQCGVADRVAFTGYLPADEVSALLDAADVGVLPFTHGVTGKSGALLTLLGHGLPTVVTAAPETELVDGEQVRLVRATRDSAALAEAIEDVLGDPSLRSRLAAGAAEYVAGRDWARVAVDHRALYERVLGG